MTANSEKILVFLKGRYPNASSALRFRNPYECLTAVLLSAQATDRSVNEAMERFFVAYPSFAALAEAKPSEVEAKIRSIGLYRSKARHLIALAQTIVRDFGGAIPSDFAVLASLPGVGPKTAGVYLLEIEKRPAIPVDTHIARIAVRLGYASQKDSPSAIEKKMEKAFPREDWAFLHHALIAFGRELCAARHPHCEACGLNDICRYFRKNSSTSGR
jgi:endonuclease-3